MSRLFHLYENVLGCVDRDTNLKSALTNPVRWQVPGSVEFLTMLHRERVKNYFVTGAVAAFNKNKQPEDMLEDISLGYS